MLLIEDLFIIGAVLLIIGVILALCFKVTISKIALWSAIYIYIIIVLGITFFPMTYGETAHIIPVPHNFIPFKTIVSTAEKGIAFTAITQLGGNILGSIPYDVYLGIAFSKLILTKLLIKKGGFYESYGFNF